MFNPFDIQVYAQAPCQNVGEEGLNLSDCLQLSSGKTVAEVYSTPTDLLNIFTRNIFIIAGIILVFMAIFAGFKMMSDSSKGKDEAVSILQTALVGFVIMFCAYWIVRVIEIFIGQEIIF